MLGVSEIRARLNHGLARLDAREATPHVAPVRRKIAPALAVGLGASLLWNNWHRAVDGPARRKSLLRDVTVITGTALGLMAGWRFTGTRMARRIADELARLIGQVNPPVQAHAKDLLKTHAGKAAEHIHEAAGQVVRKTPLERLQNLFRPQLGNHGAEGFVKLESLALGGITGGALSGLLADAMNGENLKETGSAKLKEGIFQFVGNVTFCTAAILAFATVAKKAGSSLAKSESFRDHARQSIMKTLKTLDAKEIGNPALMPTALTGAVEKTLLEKAPLAQIKKDLADLLAHELPQTSRRARGKLLSELEPAIAEGKRNEVHQAVREFATKAIREDVHTLVANPAMRAEVERLAIAQAENRGQLFGVLIGLVAGILGGAWTSNQVNAYLSKKMNLPRNNHKVYLFGPPSPGLLQGRVGERGIHWWDAILHIDDWPSALYLAGVHSLESMLGIMYGISGYLTGTAGTDYSAPKRFPLKHPELYTRGTLQRRSFDAFRPGPVPDR